MPNGSPNFLREEFPEYEVYFNPMAKPLTQFAIRYGLYLEKYYHDAPAWSFCFSHPAGGQAKLSVSQASAEIVVLDAAWRLDDYPSFCRNLKVSETETVQKKSIILIKRLTEMLEIVLEWKRGNWSKVTEGYEGFWGK